MTTNTGQSIVFQRLPTFFLLLLTATAGAADPEKSAVWRVSLNGNHLFLSGTIHMLRPSDFPLPGAFAAAFEQSDIAIFEADIDALSAPSTAAKVQEILFYPQGKSLDQQLDAATQTELTQYLQEQGLPAEQFESMTPAALVMTLTIIELRKRGLTPNGVDAHFWKQADARKMPKRWLETIEQQLGYLASYNELPANKVVRQTLEEMTEIDTLLEPMLQAWRSGDLEQLNDTLLADMREEYPGIYKTLVTKRNNRWLVELMAMLETQPVENVLVGCLHLVGPDGLLVKLKAEGATITQVLSN